MDTPEGTIPRQLNLNPFARRNPGNREKYENQDTLPTLRERPQTIEKRGRPLENSAFDLDLTDALISNNQSRTLLLLHPARLKAEQLLRRVRAITTLPRAEGIFSAFEDTAGVRRDPGVFESTDHFDVRPLSVGVNSNEQLCVSKYRDVGVVRCDNDLPLLTYVS
jgi:hypothetical protein